MRKSLTTIFLGLTLCLALTGCAAVREASSGTSHFWCALSDTTNRLTHALCGEDHSPDYPTPVGAGFSGPSCNRGHCTIPSYPPQVIK
jgi:hypothetical protein